MRGFMRVFFAKATEDLTFKVSTVSPSSLVFLLQRYLIMRFDFHAPKKVVQTKDDLYRLVHVGKRGFCGSALSKQVNAPCFCMV